MSRRARLWTLLGLELFAFTRAQLVGPVGPTTDLSCKTKECNVLDFGGLADNQTDISLAINKAFEDCVKPTPGSRLVVPQGNYLLENPVVLSNGTNWAFQLDGVITASYDGQWAVDRNLILQGSAGADALNVLIDGEGDKQFLNNMLVIVNAVDFELYSDTGTGAIQGQGYLYRNANNTVRPRMIRMISPLNASIHDLLLIDGPKFHLVLDYATNVEAYHLTVRAANLGSYDGVDVIGHNNHIHDSEITNRDECVSVKSPTDGVLIENMVCNRAGSGTSIGSLNVSASIANVHARNVSIIYGNNIAFIKTYPGGSGFVTNVTFENFRSLNSTFGMNIDQYWQNTFEPDTGAVALSNLVFRNFSGSVMDGAAHPPIHFQGNDLFITHNVTVDDFSLWTETGNTVVNHVGNVYGVGDGSYSPNDGLGLANDPAETNLPTFTTDITVTAAPTNYASPVVPTWAAPLTGYGTDKPIPIYTPAPLWKPHGEYDRHYWGDF